MGVYGSVHLRDELFVGQCLWSEVEVCHVAHTLERRRHLHTRRQQATQDLGKGGERARVRGRLKQKRQTKKGGDTGTLVRSCRPISE